MIHVRSRKAVWPICFCSWWQSSEGSSGQKSLGLQDSQASTLKTNPHLSSSNCTAGPPLCIQCVGGAHEERPARPRPGPAMCRAGSASEQVVSARQRRPSSAAAPPQPEGAPLLDDGGSLDVSVECGKGSPSSQRGLVLEMPF